MTRPQFYQKFYRRIGLGFLASIALFSYQSQQTQAFNLPVLDALTDRLAIAQPLAQLPAQSSDQPSAQSKATNGINWDATEQNMILEHNRIRQNPQSYIPILESYLASMNADGNIPNGCGANCTLLTQEGKPAVEEAIRYLRNQPPVGSLTLSPVIASVAKSHAQDQRNGGIGHRSSDGSSLVDRFNRAGVQNVAMGENISYGPTTAQDVVMALLVDDGVAERGHRTNLFAPQWQVAGVGCGTHATYRTVCVINYATE